MAAEDFFSRWAKKNAEVRVAADEVPGNASLTEAHAPAVPVDEDKALPTLEDVAQLTPDADFSAFMARGVDESVKRAAVKKLFSDPHFNVMDGLDVYIDDYNSFEALTPDIVATLRHAKGLLDPLSQSSGPSMQLLDALDEEAAASKHQEPGEQIAEVAESERQTDAPEVMPHGQIEGATQTEDASKGDLPSDAG